MNRDILLNVRTFIQSMAALSNDQIDLLINTATKTVYKKNDFFSTPEKHSTQLGYIARGLFRFYLIDRNGNEVTLGFTGDDMLMSSYGAIILNQFHNKYIQALEDSETYLIERADFLKIMESDAKWKDFLMKVTECDCLQLRKRESDFLLYDAQTRYENFLDDFSRYLGRIKQRHISSYLGISPEALSRIRKKMNSEDQNSAK